jgi:hypothetical protein
LVPKWIRAVDDLPPARKKSFFSQNLQPAQADLHFLKKTTPGRATNHVFRQELLNTSGTPKKSISTPLCSNLFLYRHFQKPSEFTVDIINPN